ncbi:MAG TPA: COX15/CtaA family protein [Casimicrobiaceae bacterium]|nr:COX15/CtaA family protein [Casimicrobiaceae bacterium]
MQLPFDARRSVATWLFACCALVFAMVVVGGVTRLTHSGLSITQWQPIVGTVPPLSESAWNDAFTRYQATPEYRDVNRGMTLREFKGIFWWEYFHRLLGRAIGVAFLLPYLWFLLRRRIPPGYAKPLAGIFVLGGLQGALGWFMVESGLVSDPRVSQFRLTAHLGLAFLIYAAMLWTGLSLMFTGRADRALPGVRRARGLAFGVAALVFLMVLSGGFVAGLRAGFAYNTFPLMQGRWVPPEIMMLAPWWRNLFWNLATVQFDHRMIAWLLAFSIPYTWWRLRRSRSPLRARRGADALVAGLAVQLSLGIATLVNGVPVPLAAMHQAGALVVFTLALNVAHALR